MFFAGGLLHPSVNTLVLSIGQAATGSFIGSVTLSVIIFAALFTSPNISIRKAGSCFSLVSQCFR